MPYPTKKLREVCDINGGNAAPQDYSVFSSDGIPFVRMQDLGKYHVTDDLTETRDKIKTEVINELGIKIFPKGSIIMPRSGSVFANHRAILGIDAAVVSHIAILNNYKGIHPKYLFWYLTKLDIGRHAVKTSNVDSISFQRLGKFEIPTPPLQTQKQIVERLDKIAEAQKLNDDLIQKTDELFQSLFYNEYEAKHNQWDSKKLQEVCKKIDQMHPSKLFKKEFSYIDIASINDDKVIRAQIISVDEAPSRARKVVKVEDTIFSTVRPYLKHIAYISEMLDGSIASTGFCVIRPNTDLVNSLFLNYVVESDHFVRRVLPFQRGANYPAVSDKNVYSIKISLPPLGTQKQIVAKLSAVQEYKTQLLAQKSKLKELFDSALAKSFNHAS